MMATNSPAAMVRLTFVERDGGFVAVGKGFADTLELNNVHDDSLALWWPHMP
jgi:hypothetical protein